MNIIITKNYLLYRNYKFKCSIGKSGVKSKKKEGDLSTPRGNFKIGKLYYRKDRIKKFKCNIQKKIIKKNMGWCDDVRSKKYNKEIIFPFKYSAENLYRRDKIYDLLINIKYNYKPTKKGMGSAIFLHIADKNYKPTKGCVALSKKNFLKIIPYIRKKTKISIS